MWAQLILLIISAVISYALAPKPPKPSPATINDVDVPDATEGRPRAVVFGSPWIKGAQVLWYGDLRSTPIRAKGGKK